MGGKLHAMRGGQEMGNKKKKSEKEDCEKKKSVMVVCERGSYYHMKLHAGG
jgi:hypothetical protein